ncbi:tetratricopeptide repeat protein [Hymenobacter fodinae]|uniref:Tetratricopeptide repeat protein n=1 Tax=Hymenobacter fodinae TaxID=2510796 RepID=A0A4Z0PCA2_9BACT|nr:tetratricopeptide repeat protein [Hymenobacter fodinae]TGE09360.1 tetratricopeptide repeat protein [Hymenobacter fodinae]
MAPSAPDLRPYLEELERFADGQMTIAEQEAFELRLEQDPALAQAFLTYEQLTADVRWVAGHETLRLRLESLDRRLNQRDQALSRIKQQQRKTQKQWGLIASLAGVGLLALWLLLRPSSSLSEEAWTRYYVPDAGLPASVINEERRPLLAEAMREYQEGRYPTALFTLRRVPTTNLGQDTLLYYTGIFLLSQGKQEAEKAQDAQTFLRKVAQQPGSVLAPKARYHLGMAYWFTKQPEQARATLQTVADDASNPYQQAARRLLQTDELPH